MQSIHYGDWQGRWSGQSHKLRLTQWDEHVGTTELTSVIVCGKALRAGVV